MTNAVRQALQAVLLTVALMVFWIACVANRQLHDWLLGAGAVAVSAAFSLFVVRTLPLRFRPSPRDLAQVWRLPWAMAVDLVQITLVLAADLAGRRAPSLFRAAPWHPVARNGHETAKRTLAVAYTTVSPNLVVIGIDVKRRLMLFHQLKATPVPRMTQELGAEDPR